MINIRFLISSDFGSDPIIGLIFIIVCILWMVISYALNGEADNPIKGGTGHAYNPNKTKRRRERRHRRRAEEISYLKTITTPNSDDKYIYIMQSMGIYKVGISNNVIHRREQIEKELEGEFIEIIYIGAVKYGRTIDAEQIIHRELKPYNINVQYRKGVNSVEWFNCSLSTILNEVKNYADLQKI